jgi:hypothetical protein
MSKRRKRITRKQLETVVELLEQRAWHPARGQCDETLYRLAGIRRVLSSSDESLILSKCSNPALLDDIVGDGEQHGGTVRPSIRAASALMTSSNFDDCTTCKSAGFSPLRMPPT